MVEKYIAARLEAGANPASINREIGVLRHVLKRAMAWTDDAGARYLTRYPLEGWKPLQENPGRTGSSTSTRSTTCSPPAPNRARDT